MVLRQDFRLLLRMFVCLSTNLTNSVAQNLTATDAIRNSALAVLDSVMLFGPKILVDVMSPSRS